MVENILTFATLVYYGSDIWTLFKYIGMMLLLKVLPLYLLMDYTVRWLHDTVVLITIFGVYNMYLAFNETNIYEIYKRTFISIKTKQNETPLFSFIHTLFRV